MSDDTRRTQILAALDAMPQIHTWPSLRAARELARRSDDPVEALLHAVGIMAREHDDMERIASQALERVPFMMPVDIQRTAQCVCGKCHGPVMIHGRVGAPCAVAP